MRVLLLQHEGNLHIDLVAGDVAILNHDVLVLHPATLHAPKRLGSTGYGLVDSILEARLRDSAQLCYSGNTHTYLCLLTVLVASLICGPRARTPNIRRPGLLAHRHIRNVSWK